jgi:hypothetical protein
MVLALSRRDDLQLSGFGRTSERLPMRDHGDDWREAECLLAEL